MTGGAVCPIRTCEARLSLVRLKDETTAERLLSPPSGKITTADTVDTRGSEKVLVLRCDRPHENKVQPGDPEEDCRAAGPGGLPGGASVGAVRRRQTRKH